MSGGSRWSEAELQILRTVYVEKGLEAAAALLPGRAGHSIYVRANKLGLRTQHRPARQGMYRQVADQALALRKQGLSYRKIGERLGMCEAAATNSVLVGECLAAGHRPLERGPDGRIAAEGRERLRLMLRKGMKHRDIQVRCGISAATITRERRLYEGELKDRRLAPLPPPGGGERYSGARIALATRREVERLYQDGYGAKKISEATGVSYTHCLRIRERLVKRLKRKGVALAGCDIDGRRHAYKDHRRAIPQANLDRLKQLLIEGEPVARAARLAVVGGSTAYRIYHQLLADFAARGEELPRKPWRGRGLQRQSGAIKGLPGGRWGIDRYRALAHDGVTHQDASAQVRAEWRERVAALPFEERIALQLREGATIAPVMRFAPAAIERTLGGIATGAIL